MIQQFCLYAQKNWKQGLEHIIFTLMFTAAGLPRVVPVVKNSPANEGDARGAGSIPGSERSPRVGSDNPGFFFFFFCILKNFIFKLYKLY